MMNEQKAEVAVQLLMSSAEKELWDGSYKVARLNARMNHLCILVLDQEHDLREARELLARIEMAVSRRSR